MPHSGRVRIPAAILLSSFAATCPLPAQGVKGAAEPAVTQRPEYRMAVQALRDKLPEVAAARLKKLLASGTVKSPAAGPVKLLLAEALVRSGKAEEGLAAASSAEVRDSTDAGYWRGAALAKLRRFTEAEKELASLAADSRYAIEAAMTRASALAALGQTTPALELLRSLTTSKDAEISLRAKVWSAELMLAARRPAADIAAMLPSQVQGRYAPQVRYLRARLALSAGNATEAAAQFAALADGGRGISPSLVHAAALGRALALHASGKQPEALGALEKLIGLSPPPSQPVLLAAFDAFERLNSPPGAEAENFLNIWAKSEHEDIRVLARMAAAAAREAAGRPADALAACQAIANDAPQSGLLPWVLLREARLSLLSGNREAVAVVAARLEPLAASPAVRAWTAWLKGTAGFDEKQFEAAAGQFTRAANESTTPEAQAAAAYNAALAELQSGVSDPHGPLALLDGIDSQASRIAGAEFHLERALHMAAADEPGAQDGLIAFVEALPDHPRRFEALVALAELSLHADPVKPDDARRRIAEAAAAAKDPAALETAAWLKVLAAEKTAAPDEYAKEAAAFLAAWPQTARRAPLRMRLAEMYFRRQNFAGARQQFEQLVKDDPLHPLSEAALFWAGKSALLTLGTTSGDDAIALWEQVHKRGGPLKLEARLQVALLKQRRNDYAGALQLLSGIMESKPPPDNGTRRQVFCARGEILVAQNASPELVAQGLASFDQLVSDPLMPPEWRHEAMVRKGVCLEQLKRPDEALEAWHAVLSEPPAGEGADDYWYHRAGEKALRMLEARHKYEEAVTIAEKMALAPGARGRLAAELGNQLALKYGIYRETIPAP